MKMSKTLKITIQLIIVCSIAIPLLWVGYYVIIMGKESVVLLADYPSAIGVLIISYYGIVFLCILLWLIWQIKQLLDLKNEKIKNELLHLQSQVNPHFFFNMLNNIYGTMDKDIDRAKKIVLKLSDVMRYSIYEGEKPMVSLLDEITYLQQYIELHQMRYHKTIAVSFEVDTPRNEQIKLMPLVLIVLVENAFKHGVERLTKDAFVTIQIRTNNGILHIEVSNNFDSESRLNSKGIGLRNLKRRLELAYPKKHNLILEERENEFMTKLQLQYD